MTITITDIAQISRLVSRLAAMQQWQFSAVPVICFEFSTMRDFFHAKMQLEQMIAELPLYASFPKARDVFTRPISPDTLELDCMGVTFRLTCLERLDTPAGPMGAAESKGNPPTFNWGQLQNLRKSGGY